MNKDLLIFIPTFNERENVETLLNQLLALNLSADILFVDDNSPDGTGKLLEQLALKYSCVLVEHRAGKFGIGSAHRYGIAWAYNHGYRKILTMDCDFTHSPEYISQFLELAENADVVVGSRYLKEGSLSTWNARRRLLTRLGHWATDLFLDMPYDATGGFRVYRLDLVSKHFLNLIKSDSYSFFFESLFVLHCNRYKIVELATELPARTYGHSKMRMQDALSSLKHLMHLYVRKSIDKKQFDIVEPLQLADLATTTLLDPQGWNDYWSRNDRKQSHVAYDLIAAFYRRFIIRPSLNKFVLNNFPSSSTLMHAGCGSGQVDCDIAQKRSIIALDISPVALGIYKKTNRNVKSLIHASIFDIPLISASIDGVYNLGVMEHFTEDEIFEILTEFNRVLLPNGKVVLFWPPKYGLSVMVLKLVHIILNRVLNKNVMLHPAEITHITSKKHAELLLSKSGFALREYSFGIGDLFTHAILVGEKVKNIEVEKSV